MADHDQYMSDEDVKVANFSDQDAPVDDTEELIEDVQEQKQNGNIDKARKLGRLLAQEVDSNDGEFIFGLDQQESADIICQRRLLLAFVVNYGLEIYLKNQLVSQTAQNTFFETIQNTSPSIDKDIKQQGAFSYYYLCVRDSEKPAEAIGKTFAELCDRKGDCIYAKLGSALFEYFLVVVDDRVKALQFQE